MKSSYQLKNQTTRINGPAVGQVIGTQTFFNGYFREDYEYVSHAGDAAFLDIHNGRVCNTPEYPASLYPDGIYCYFTTVDANHNSAYPYVVGPTFYGNKVVTAVTTVPDGTITYLSNDSFDLENAKVVVYPNPSQDFIAIQTEMAKNDRKVELINELGQIVKTSKILQGSTLSIIETDSVYNGVYFVKISNRGQNKSYKVILKK
jgi:hypothetical protein